MTENSFQLRKVRDFGERIGDAVLFTRINWVNLLILYAVFVVPFLLIGIILGANSISDFLTKFTGGLDSLSGLLGWKMITATIMFLLASASYAAVVYLYMDQFESNHGLKPTVSEIGNLYPRALIYNIGYTLLVVILFIPVFLLIAGMAIALKAQLAIFFLAIPLLFFLGLFAMVYIMMIYPVNIIGKGSFGSALGETFRLLHGRWWFSIGYFFVLLIIYYFFAMAISTIFNVIFGLTAINFTDPNRITRMGKGFMYVFGLTTLVQQIFYLIIFVGTGIHYYSTQEEKMGSGLEEKIDQLGMSPGQKTDNEQY